MPSLVSDHKEVINKMCCVDEWMMNDIWENGHTDFKAPSSGTELRAWEATDEITAHGECVWHLCTHMLLLLSRFSRARLCVTTETAAHQAPPSLGFSRQEHWSGFPFPSPMHEREKGKWSRSVVSNSSWPHGLQPTRLLRPWDFPGKSTGVGCHRLLCPHSRRHS